mmetsp:Transcript_31691/g.57745  ORF Transcript_31691/g.57745 Transcript_31691/m.57745 type:complete len:375 (+) Transcript_31691:29-1153(+)
MAKSGEVRPVSPPAHAELYLDFSDTDITEFAQAMRENMILLSNLIQTSRKETEQATDSLGGMIRHVAETVTLSAQRSEARIRQDVDKQMSILQSELAEARSARPKSKPGPSVGEKTESANSENQKKRDSTLASLFASSETLEQRILQLQADFECRLLALETGLPVSRGRHAPARSPSADMRIPTVAKAAKSGSLSDSRVERKSVGHGQRPSVTRKQVSAFTSGAMHAAVPSQSRAPLGHVAAPNSAVRAVSPNPVVSLPRAASPQLHGARTSRHSSPMRDQPGACQGGCGISWGNLVSRPTSPRVGQVFATSHVRPMQANLSSAPSFAYSSTGANISATAAHTVIASTGAAGSSTGADADLVIPVPPEDAVKGI